MQLADYVLAKLSKQEKQEMELACEEAARAAIEIVQKGIGYAQERHNGEKK